MSLLCAQRTDGNLDIEKATDSESPFELDHSWHLVDMDDIRSVEGNLITGHTDKQKAFSTWFGKRFGYWCLEDWEEAHLL